ncbi:MAG TPA: hypothetical protein VHL78_05545 [Actinomycetota bacterium]|nr:hypothetical protein [Actinomycetota bacterium]
MGLAFLFANVLPADGFPSVTEGYPSPFGPAAEIERFFAENREEVRALSATLALMALSLLVFSASIVRALREVVSGRGLALTVALGGGVLASAFVMMSAILTWTLPRPQMLGETAVLRAVHDLTYLAGGPAHVLFVSVFLGAASVAMLPTPTVPRWVIWVGIAGAALSVFAVVAMFWQPATYILPASRVFLGAWILGLCLTMVEARLARAFRRREAAPQPG